MPKLMGPLATIQPKTPESERFHNECLRRAGPGANSEVRKLIRDHCLNVDSLTRALNDMQLLYELQAYAFRTQTREPVTVNMGQRLVNLGPAVETHAEEIYASLADVVTASLYAYMWGKIAAAAKLPLEVIDTGDLEETYQTYRRLCSESDYLRAWELAIDSGLKVLSFILLKHSAPDFDPKSALDVRLGNSLDSEPLLISEADKAVERRELGRAIDLAEQAGINTGRDGAYALETAEVIGKRLWWEKSKPVHHLNRSIKFERQKVDSTYFERTAAARRFGVDVRNFEDCVPAGTEDPISAVCDRREVREARQTLITRASETELCEQARAELRQRYRALIRGDDGRRFFDLRYGASMSQRAIMDATGWDGRRYERARKATENTMARMRQSLRDKPLKHVLWVSGDPSETIIRELLDSARAPGTGAIWITQHTDTLL